jgi:hypothetical protein
MIHIHIYSTLSLHITVYCRMYVVIKYVLYVQYSINPILLHRIEYCNQIISKNKFLNVYINLFVYEYIIKANAAFICWGACIYMHTSRLMLQSWIRIRVHVYLISIHSFLSQTGYEFEGKPTRDIPRLMTTSNIQPTTSPSVFRG